ncbi:unnamed protein product, partial [Meganyctiphanes norvegica]
YQLYIVWRRSILIPRKLLMESVEPFSLEGLDDLQDGWVYSPVTSTEKSYYIPGYCLDCHQRPTSGHPIKSCSRCRLVQYCSKECQKKHFTIHKTLCRATAVTEDKSIESLVSNTEDKSLELSVPKKNIYAIAKDPIKAGMSWDDFRDQLTEIIVKKMGRQPTELERIIIHLPRVCQICKESDQNLLEECSKCHIVVYCSKEHHQQDLLKHSKNCHLFSLEAYCVILESQRGIPLPLHVGFEKSYTYEPLPSTITELLNESHPLLNVYLSEWVTCSYSLIFALERIDCNSDKPHFTQSKQLSILLVGIDPNNGPLFMNEIWLPLLNFLPQLKQLHVTILDENLASLADSTTHLENKINNPNNEKDVGIVLQVKGCTYDQYLKDSKFVSPDVILANQIPSQSLEDDSSHIRTFDTKPDVPLVIMNSFKSRIKNYIYALCKTHKVDTILPIQLNPFHGQRPVRIDIEEEPAVTYSNHFITVVQLNKYEKLR